MHGMSDELKVDVPALDKTARHIDMTADELRARHNSAHLRISAAQRGWIGGSAVALAAKAAQWEEESARHYTDLVERGHDFRSAAASYLETDSESASAIDEADPSLRDLGL
ncbi:WXG100 family type VII secretion target [Mycolicibacterium novocastrense]|uniref:WXG100 family type VII secretion target n=2 Tax=Mycolicibacterium novocastrense TaxID=59813 RepID=A0ABQ0KK93_MYCNV|nr:WXG100 family type VII secretion target [Mycolicibacterium novocastrense]